MTNNPLPVVFGCAGPVLSDAEVRFFRETNPLGFILFGRNCLAPDQIKALVDDLRNSIGRADAPVLIDQEGGRVSRLKPPHWPAYPAARAFGDAARADRTAALEAVRLNSMLIGLDLNALGISVNCAPTIDVPIPGAHEMIGSRAYGPDPLLVSEMGRAVCEGLFDANVLPVIKHLPGYGRAMVDSHLALPVIAEGLDELDATDFVPFKALASIPWGMTAHALVRSVDPDRPATLSPAVIKDVIRQRIGFKGILITDDLSMNALAGDVSTRSMQALAAGCDVALHCNGDMAEMESIARVARPMSSRLLGDIEAAERMRVERVRPDIDPQWARGRVQQILGNS
ncbi:glycoside hydrolase family 3 protein [Bradyrhizobium sp. INPA01-394B]|uniref:beta-N-acetylhexosaminidase n=1 Tax=Bradyrhizobium campsiandrae TaxID=1729892 RepID=A0ABR7U5G1_9BRAD|nr:glycoside hydrolase family 3 protein [Bradyrhizobium campsiandrae]MBC9880928.1 glycoside hydrolase family 3 protein [Bradyrhizobium campsiandrae]MBC9978810.1 glycoside hydrolase family 3 protein [Bradyrhizobium campsiandrae]